jgi:hypothetical protein
MLRFKCDECKKKCRKLRRYKNKMLCWKCWSIKFNKIGCFNQKRKKITLDEALNKTYYLKGRINKFNQITLTKNFPSILAGHKIRIVLIK